MWTLGAYVRWLSLCPQLVGHAWHWDLGWVRANVRRLQCTRQWIAVSRWLLYPVCPNHEWKEEKCQAQWEPLVAHFVRKGDLPVESQTHHTVFFTSFSGLVLKPDWDWSSVTDKSSTCLYRWGYTRSRRVQRDISSVSGYCQGILNEVVRACHDEAAPQW